jgi:tetratricopeptide (TPR) repeat protein
VTPAVCDPTADALLDAGERTLARDAYAKALSANPTLRCAVTRLAAIRARENITESAKAKAKCDRAQDLADVGKEKEAEALYVEVLKTRDEQCAREGLTDLRSDAWWTEDALQDANDWLAAASAAFALLATFMLILAAIGALIIVGITYFGRFGRRFGRFFLRTRLGVGVFTDGGVDPPIGAGVTNLVRIHLRRMALKQEQGGSDYGLDRVTGIEGIAKSIGGLADLAPQFKALSALLLAIPSLGRFPRYTLNGSLQRGTPRGAGLTVILDHQRWQGEGITLWSQTTADAASYQALAAGAAAWTDFLVREQTEQEQTTPFTKDAESYAYLRTGFQLERDDRRADARCAYVSAIRADPTNVAALLNLSVAAARDGDLQDAVTWLRTAKDLLDAEKA